MATAKKTAHRRAVGVVTNTGKFVTKLQMEAFALKASGSKQLNDRFTAKSYGATGLVEPIYAPAVSARIFDINTYHARACRVKANDIAGLGFTLVPKGGKRKKSTVVAQPAGTEPADPNAPAPVDPEQAALDAEAAIWDTWLDNLIVPLSETLTKAQTDFETMGFATVELATVDNKARGVPDQLYHLPALTMRVHKDGWKWAQRRGTALQWFLALDARDKKTNEPITEMHDNGTTDNVDDETRAHEVMVWKNYSPSSEDYGAPDWVPAIGAIYGENSRRDYNIAFFDNFGIPAYAVFVTGDFDNDDDEAETDEENASTPSKTKRTALETLLEEQFQDIQKNPGSTIIMAIPSRSGMNDAPGGEVKVTFERLAADVTDASFRLYRMDNRDEVLAAHGVPPYRLGIAETGSLGGSTAEESTEIYKTSVVEPRQRTIQDLFNKHILPRLGITNFVMEMLEIDTVDERHELELQDILVKMGAMDAEEVRELWADRFGLKDRDPALTPASTGVDLTAIEAGVETVKRLLEGSARAARKERTGAAT